MDREDGEMSDDNAMLVDDDDPASGAKGPSYDVLYKAEKNGLKIEKLEKVDAKKIEERAKRFGLNLAGNRVITQKQIDELYTNFGIESSNERHFRLDTLHLNGVDGLTTKEIFAYLEDYKPISLEWIDNNSCNIVCQDHVTTSLALLVHSREINREELQKILSTDAHHWREGMPHEKKDLILMRFATKSDKKQTLKKPEKHIRPIIDQSMEAVSKNPWGDLCQSWGVYDHQEILNPRLKLDYEDEEDEVSNKPIRVKNQSLAKRLGKRRQTSEASDSSSSIEWRRQSKAPRMRMRADDEESRIKKKKQETVFPKDSEEDSFAPLSIEVSNTSSHYRPKEFTKLSDKFKRHAKSQTDVEQTRAPPSILSRLGAKVRESPASVGESSDEDWSSGGSSATSDRVTMSRVRKLGKPRSSSASDVWSRLETNISTKSTSDLRQTLKSRTNNRSSDLRRRLGKSKPGISLRIEVDNDDYHSSD